MPLRSSHLAMLIFAVVPALGVRVDTGHSTFVASFFYACPKSHPAPRVRTRSLTESPLEPRLPTSPVGLFPSGTAPAKPYRRVGTVEVVARDRHTTSDQLIHSARAAVRRLGGDAMVEVTWRGGSYAPPNTFAPGPLAMSAEVVRWE